MEECLKVKECLRGVLMGEVLNGGVLKRSAQWRGVLERWKECLKEVLNGRSAQEVLNGEECLKECSMESVECLESA
ncbi:hypothetical protein Hamer_G015303 [Homarus americanus]|uniref:Uncharacterized protein n=1 Tax=Homarus americanus TaxID=6706 RepID=A0A8J5TI13_HOMAM|nr:hypothetical protein Hamer_G015303 [Homarus americanus]